MRKGCERNCADYYRDDGGAVVVSLGDWKQDEGVFLSTIRLKGLQGNFSSSAFTAKWLLGTRTDIRSLGCGGVEAALDSRAVKRTLAVANHRCRVAMGPRTR